MDVNKLCIDLAQAEDEAEVVSLLEQTGYWGDATAWRDYGGTENNYNTVGNQQAEADSALVEKLTNSIDAVLMAECMLRGIDPESSEAPQSMREAVDRFFGITNGILFGMEASMRNQLATRICLVATGAKRSPSFSIIDKGEGQSPKKMPETLLSLSKGIKQRIPFVQGKFNMGGTGILRFCGVNSLQLIISKRHPEVAKSERDYSKIHWGFTVVRRFNPPRGYKSSVFKYLAPGGEILSFSADQLPLLPGSTGAAYGQPLEWGTFIKLYDFKIKGYTTNILFDLYNRLSLLMAGAALPIRLYERRGFEGHTLETTLSGLSVRLEEDRRENLEENFPASAEISVRGKQLKASIALFKRDKSVKYKKQEGVIFLVNGQSHGSLSRQFFDRKTVGMGYLAKDLLVLIDCSELDGRSIEDLFMNSRDRLSEGPLKAAIEDGLEELLSSHPGLKEHREKRKREEFENSATNIESLEQFFENLVRRSPSLARVFQHGNRITNPFRLQTGKTQPFQGYKFPSLFRLDKEFPLSLPKAYHLSNVRFRIQFVTDAVNDYFVRDDHPGRFELQLDGSSDINYDLNLWNGIGTLNISPPSGFREGHVLNFTFHVTDPTRVEPFAGEFHVEVRPPIEATGGGSGKRKSTGTKGRGSAPSTDQLGLPNWKLVRKNEWPIHGFDERSAVRIVSNENKTYDFFINGDNAHLLTECKLKYKADPQLLRLQFVMSMLAVGVSLIEVGIPAIAGESEGGMSLEDYVSQVTRAFAVCIFPIVDSIGDIDESAVVEAYDALYEPVANES